MSSSSPPPPSFSAPFKRNSPCRVPPVLCPWRHVQAPRPSFPSSMTSALPPGLPDDSENIQFHQQNFGLKISAQNKTQVRITCSSRLSFASFIFWRKSRSPAVSWYPFIPFSMESENVGSEESSRQTRGRRKETTTITQGNH